MPFEFPESDDHLYWLHVDGPDGRAVLLGRYDDRTQTITLVDDACTSYTLEGNWLHKWRIYRAEPVIRPNPAQETSDS